MGESILNDAVVVSMYNSIQATIKSKVSVRRGGDASCRLLRRSQITFNSLLGDGALLVWMFLGGLLIGVLFGMLTGLVAK